ncbi:hypothetical protein JCM19238_3087 [Vibrio ponticus]|nr:hypothetical protein JCM19238_3087 [Vibrio ponticus]
MKVAVQLFGHLRSYESTYEYLFAHILDKYDCDVFIHTWDELEHRDPTWHKQNYDIPDNNVNAQKVKGIYSPKNILIESNVSVRENGFFNRDITLRGLKAMLYSQYKVNQIREEYQETHGVEYDFVITLRPDVLVLAELDLNRYVQEFSFSDRASVHFSNGMHVHMDGTKKILTPLAIDLFFIAKPKVAGDICSSYINFNKYYVDYSSTYIDDINASEASYLEAIQSKGIVPKYYAFPYVVKRLRGDKHLIVGMECLSNFTRKLELPDFIEEYMSLKPTAISRILNALPDKVLGKLKKQLTRSKRTIGNLIELCDLIRLNRN